MRDEAMDDAPRVAVVTGGAQGIGAAVVAALTARGYLVAILDINNGGTASSTDATAGSREQHFACDVSDRDQVVDAMKRVASRLGAPSVLVNNAGISDYAPFAELSYASWVRTLAVNLTGPFNCAQAFLSHVPSAGGAIVNITSVAAHVATPGAGAYAAAKSGLVGLTRVMAVELAPRNIRVNGVSPGVVDTPMRGSFSKEAVNARLKRVPLSRSGEAAEIASVVAFLSSDDASFITGQIVIADGGWTANGV